MNRFTFARVGHDGAALLRGDWMGSTTAEKAAGPKVRFGAGKEPANPAAKAFKDGVNASGLTVTRLARLAGVTAGALTLLLDRGIHEINDTVGDVCGYAGIDPNAMLEGRFVQVPKWRPAEPPARPEDVAWVEAMRDSGKLDALKKIAESLHAEASRPKG